MKSAPATPGALPEKARGGFVKNVGPAVAWTALIFLGGGSHTGAPPGDFGLYVPLDKLQHVAAFLVLQWLSYRALRFELPQRGRLETALLAGALALVVGVLLEVYQLALPDRSAEVADAVADAIGAGLGALVVGWRAARRQPT